MSGPEKIRASEEKYRSATESVNRAEDEPGGVFYGQLVPLEKGLTITQVLHQRHIWSGS